ncbi:MAG TPA: KilA-N domain-containing protein [Bacteroidia bacterium]|nr:KilA-N domain-containing protein [Bacteroidia bacterium]
METNIQTAQYHNTEIEFDLRPNLVMINASQMAAPFGKRTVEFLTNKVTKSFIKACLTGGNSHQMGFKKESDLVVVKAKSGTWMHRVLALKFAAWLSPELEVWVYATVEHLLYGDVINLKNMEHEIYYLKYHVEQQKIICRENEAFRKLEELQTKLYQAHSRKRIQYHKSFGLKFQISPRQIAEANGTIRYPEK